MNKNLQSFSYDGSLSVPTYLARGGEQLVFLASVNGNLQVGATNLVAVVHLDNPAGTVYWFHSTISKAHYYMPATERWALVARKGVPVSGWCAPLEV